MKSIRVGQLIYWRNEAAIVLELKGFTEVIIRTLEEKRTEIASVHDITLGPTSSESKQAPHLATNDKEWDKAVERFEIIKPLLEMPLRQEEDVKKVADEIGKSATTLYRWMKRFEETGLVSSLLRTPRSDKGEVKLSKEVEEIIQVQINNYFLKQERPSVIKLYQMIKLECLDEDLIPPHKNTVHARAREIDEQIYLRRRYSPRIAKQKYQPLRGGFPGGNFPNAVVQIDHTPVDIILVDEKHRLPIGRPYLTIAIDVATKMLTGFYLTLDPPSALSAGLCIAHSVMRKEHWLAKRDIHAEWPIYGKMEMIHLDNAKEFRGTMLQRACEQYGIILEHRPKGQPNYGPHVERAFRTFMGESHSLPGTTFSSIKDKLDYDSEGKACLTLSELELWFTTFIVYCYHHRAHKGINDVAPIKLYHQMVHGTDEQPGIGLPASIEDEVTFKLNFTPYVERTVQRHGVVIDNIQYYSPALRRWVEKTEPNNKKKKMKFIFARDPRDISVVHFLEPESNTYVQIPYFNASRPAISLWELKAAQKYIKDKAQDGINEDMIFKGIKKMREIEAEAIEKTRLSKQSRASEKRKRRTAERRNTWSGTNVKTAIDMPLSKEPVQDDDMDKIKPFDDIQIG